MARPEIVPVVQTYAAPLHIRKQVQKKQLADQRKASQHADRKPVSSSSTVPKPDSSVRSTSTSAPNSAASSRQASTSSSSSLTSTASPSQPSQKSRFSLLKRARRLLTPPQSPELIGATVAPKPSRMPEENKQLMRFCTVCASNQNRSMEAHKVLLEHGYNVQSFGTGSNVRLPGPAMDKPQVYEFGTPYNQMYTESKRQNPKSYMSNGVLNMSDRNRHIKDHPEQWSKQNDVFDVVITCQEKCFDSVCSDSLHRGAKLCRPVHVINVEIEDNHHEAALGAKAILDFVDMVAQSPDPDAEMLEVSRKWQKTHQKYPSMYQLCYA